MSGKIYHIVIFLTGFMVDTLLPTLILAHILTFTMVTKK